MHSGVGHVNRRPLEIRRGGLRVRDLEIISIGVCEIIQEEKKEEKERAKKKTLGVQVFQRQADEEDSGEETGKD